GQGQRPVASVPVNRPCVVPGGLKPLVRAPGSVAPVRLGLGANAAQFGLLVAVNALVGGMVGQERTVLPLLARDTFGLAGVKSALTFGVPLGRTQATTDLAAGVAP